MKKFLIGLICIIAVMALIALPVINCYNGMITKEENVTGKLSDLDVMLQRRADLIPNLVNTVKGYAAHETQIIEKVTEAREKLVNAGTLEEKSLANSELTSSLNSLLALAESYPDLKSSELFAQLSDELAGTENRIAVAREDYNNAVKTFNTSVKRFPNNILASMFGIEQAQYFEADASSAEVPDVSFE